MAQGRSMEVFDPEAWYGSNLNQSDYALVDRYNIFIMVFLSDSGHLIIYPVPTPLPGP